MTSNFFPSFDWQQVFLQPWSENFAFSCWIVLMGFLTTAACGLVGNYLLLRRMALVGDAISHSILPGLVAAFLIFRTSNTWTMFFGAFAAGLVTVALIGFIQRRSRIKPDAAICIAFTTLFALGVVMLSLLEGRGTFHLDAECVLYGEIAFIPLELPVTLGGWSLGPPSVVRMGLVLLGCVTAIVVFYKELLITSFDPGLARSMGMRAGLWHYGLMSVLALVIVSSFEAVGAILAVAMLIVPPMFAAQLSDHLPMRLGLTVLHAALSALIGYHLSVWLSCSPAGAMVVAGAALFTLVWGGTLLHQRLQRGTATPQLPDSFPEHSR